MNFESFPQSEAIEKAPRGFLSVLRENISKSTKLASLTALAWLSVEAADAAPKSVEQRYDTIHCTFEGEGDHYAEFALSPEAFGHEFASEKLEVRDPQLASIAMGDEEIAGLRFIKKSENNKKWNELMEAELSKPELLKKAGIETSEDAENPTPKQAVLLAKHIILENLYYSDTIADAQSDLGSGDLEEQEMKEKLYAEGLQNFHEDMQERTPEEIFGEKPDITCGQATDLYEVVFSWLKEKHGEKLKNAYARRQAGVSVFSGEYDQTNHAWNKVVLLEDMNKDGIADGAEVVFVDATPLTRIQKEAGEELGRGFEFAEAAQAIGKLREQEILSEYELRSLYEDLRNTVEEFSKKMGLPQEDLDAMMRSIIVSMTRDGLAVQGKEKEYFDGERLKYNGNTGDSNPESPAPAAQ